MVVMHYLEQILFLYCAVVPKETILSYLGMKDLPHLYTPTAHYKPKPVTEPFNDPPIQHTQDTT